MSAKNLNPHTIARKLTSAVNALLMAQARAEVLREKVDTIKARLLAERDYLPRWKDDERLASRPELAEQYSKPVRDPKLDYWLTDEDCVEYFAKLESAVAADETLPKPSKSGNCPALEADTLRLKCEELLIDCAAEQIPDVAKVRERLYGEHRRKMLDLLIGMVVNQTGYRSPLAVAHA